MGIYIHLGKMKTSEESSNKEEEHYLKIKKSILQKETKPLTVYVPNYVVSK